MYRKIKLLGAASALMTPLSVCAIELTDYTTVESLYQEAFVDGSLNFNQGNQPRSSYSGSADGSYRITQSTLPLVLDFGGNGALTFDRSKEKDTSTSKNYNFAIDGSADKYFNPENLFLGYGGFSTAYSVTDAGASRSINTGSCTNIDSNYVKCPISNAESSKVTKTFASLTGGVGYGRVINATPLADVLRIMEELRRYNLIAREPSNQTYLDLAAVVAREQEYKDKYGLVDYNLYWIDELEKIMQKAGVLKNNTLGTVGVIKTQKVLIDQPISVRKHGWIGKLGVGVAYDNVSYDKWSGPNKPEDVSNTDPTVEASFEYALPFSYELQLINQTRYFSLFETDMIHHFKNTLSLNYEIADRMDWDVLIWDLDMTIPTKDGAKDTVENSFRSIFHYYITPIIDLNLKLAIHNLEDNVDNNGNDDWDKSMVFGIRYRLK